MNNPETAEQHRSIGGKILDGLSIVSLYAGAYVLDAAARNPEVYDALVQPPVTDVDTNLLRGGAWIFLGAAVLKTAQVCIRQR